MMDTTMRLFSFDQCSIVLVHSICIIHDEVCERVIAGLKHAIFTYRQALFDTLHNILDVLNLPIEN